MQEFTEEFKKIKDALDKCWGERGSAKDGLNSLIEVRKKVFVNIALNIEPTSKKKEINNEIRQLEEDVSDLDIMIEGLQLKQTLLKRSGSHVREKVEVD